MADVGLGYHAGNASKYIFRWRKKNGLEDLNKAMHYIDKCEELNVSRAPTYSYESLVRLERENGLTLTESAALMCLMDAQWVEARFHVQRLVEAAKYLPQIGKQAV